MIEVTIMHTSAGISCACRGIILWARSQGYSYNVTIIPPSLAYIVLTPAVSRITTFL